MIRYPIRKFFFWIYSVPIEHENEDELEFQIPSEIKDFDCLITANITGVLFLLSIIGGGLMILGRYISTYNIWLSLAIQILGFIVFLNSMPVLSEFKQFKNIKLFSVFKWVFKLVILALPTYVFVFNFLSDKGLALLTFCLTLTIPLYRYKEQKHPQRKQLIIPLSVEDSNKLKDFDFFD